MPNLEAPHQAVILVRCEIYERLPDGRCTGRPAGYSSNIYTFFGKDFEDAKKQAETFLERLKNNDATETQN
jgi:hypothetical protein